VEQGLLIACESSKVERQWRSRFMARLDAAQGQWNLRPRAVLPWMNCRWRHPVGLSSRGGRRQIRNKTLPQFVKRLTPTLIPTTTSYGKSHGVAIRSLSLGFTQISAGFVMIRGSRRNFRSMIAIWSRGVTCCGLI
jgi:hypothetical protein